MPTVMPKETASALLSRSPRAALLNPLSLFQRPELLPAVLPTNLLVVKLNKKNHNYLPPEYFLMEKSVYLANLPLRFEKIQPLLLLVFRPKYHLQIH